jgi:ABC-type phosphate transport system substrate-binding protein
MLSSFDSIRSASGQKTALVGRATIDLGGSSNSNYGDAWTMNKAKTLGYSLVMLAIAVITVAIVMGWHGQECRLANHVATQPNLHVLHSATDFNLNRCG